jgi:poly-beta-hydroxyalkanoate depolymerase
MTALLANIADGIFKALSLPKGEVLKKSRHVDNKAISRATALNT